MKLTDTIEIVVGTHAGTYRETVPAKRYGRLAVHKDIVQGKRQLWKVSHPSSGLMVLGELTLKAAVAIAKELQHLPEWDDPRITEGYTGKTAALFNKLTYAVDEARKFHTDGGTRLVQEAA